MRQKKQQRYTHSLILAGILCLSSCTTANYSYNCPVYPVAGKPVYEELKNIPYQGYEDFWEWMGRINKLRGELEICR